MPTIPDVEREFLAQEWRWLESADATVKDRHSGAREAEYATAFVTVAGATVAMTIIDAATKGDKKLIVGTCEGILPVSFRGRPPTVRVRTSRFGFTISPGRLMLVERCDLKYGDNVTTLYLTG